MLSENVLSQRNERKEAIALALKEVFYVFCIHQQNALFRNSVDIFTTFTALC